MDGGGVSGVMAGVKLRTPRPYQTELIDDLRSSLYTHRRVLVQLPTGGGKTFCAATIAKGAAAKGKRVYFVVHRIELLEQASQTFTDDGITHGILVAGRPTPQDRIIVAMEATLARRLGTVVPPDLLFDDECHHAVAATRMRIAQAWPDAWSVGLTATPIRLDGKGLRDRYDAMVCGPTTAELIQQGWLSKYKAFAPSTPDLSGVRKRCGDFSQEDIDDVMRSRAIVGDIVSHYCKLAFGKRAIIFAASIAHSIDLIAAFTAAGIPAAHLDGETPADRRRAVVTAFAAGSIHVLSNVGLFGEGFDVPAVESVILARPTQSLGLHLQMIGRALRPFDGKPYAVILDHAGNLGRLGFPDDDFAWSLDGVEKRARDTGSAVSVVQCLRCYCCYRPAPACPECGYAHAPKPRELKQVDGDLVEVRREDERRQWRQKQGRAQSIDDLVAIGRAKGMKNPFGWAKHVLQARSARRFG